MIFLDTRHKEGDNLIFKIMAGNFYSIVILMYFMRWKERHIPPCFIRHWKSSHAQWLQAAPHELRGGNLPALKGRRQGDQQCSPCGLMWPKRDQVTRPHGFRLLTHKRDFSSSPERSLFLPSQLPFSELTRTLKIYKPWLIMSCEPTERTDSFFYT